MNAFLPALLNSDVAGRISPETIFLIGCAAAQDEGDGLPNQLLCECFRGVDDLAGLLDGHLRRPHLLFDGLTIHRLTPRASFIFIRCNKSSLQCSKIVSDFSLVYQKPISCHFSLATHFPHVLRADRANQGFCG
jgi:hypothetical protein